jgi:hypothetical protein
MGSLWKVKQGKVFFLVTWLLSRGVKEVEVWVKGVETVGMGIEGLGD